MRGISALAFGLDQARRDEINRNSARREFNRQRLGQSVQTRLGGNHMRPVYRADIGGEAANIDDRPAPLLPRAQARPPVHTGTRRRAHGENLAPLVERDLLERTFGPHACIVDQNVQAAEFMHGFIDHAAARLPGG